jgi:hypothetical protein
VSPAASLFSHHFRRVVTTTQLAQNGAVGMREAPNGDSLREEMWASRPSARDSLWNQHQGSPNLGEESKLGPGKIEKQASW